MFLIKALLTGFVGISLCMANISGIVTDTGLAPIAGAVVQLEKGGQAAISGVDGSFTLVPNTAILPVNGKLFPNGLSARIAGNMLNVTLTGRAAVEIVIFNLSGKVLSTVRKTMDAGSHSLTLPYQGAGVYLYKVKSGKGELVLKGNSVGRISFGSSVTTRSSSSNLMAKQAKVTSAINDVIAAAKTGYLNYRCVQYNSDTSGILIKMIGSAGTISDIDGNVYQTVRIGNQVWMTENLRVTKYNDGTPIPLDTSSLTWEWDAVGTSKYCYYGNTTNVDSIKKFGALYNWYVVDTANPHKIALSGWHFPTYGEWDTLRNYLIANGHNWDGTTAENKIAKSLSAKTDWLTDITSGAIGNDLTKNNKSGFSAMPGGYRHSNGGFYNIGSSGWWWARQEGSSNPWGRGLGCESGSAFEQLWVDPREGYSVRLVRNSK